MVMELLASLLYFDIFVKILCFVFVLYSRFLSLLWYLQSGGGAKTFHPVVVWCSVSCGKKLKQCVLVNCLELRGEGLVGMLL